MSMVLQNTYVILVGDSGAEACPDSLDCVRMNLDSFVARWQTDVPLNIEVIGATGQTPQREDLRSRDFLKFRYDFLTLFRVLFSISNRQFSC